MKNIIYFPVSVKNKRLSIELFLLRFFSTHIFFSYNESFNILPCLSIKLSSMDIFNFRPIFQVEFLWYMLSIHIGYHIGDIPNYWVRNYKRWFIKIEKTGFFIDLIPSVKIYTNGLFVISISFIRHTLSFGITSKKHYEDTLSSAA